MCRLSRAYLVNTCNTLRLRKSEAAEFFDFRDFNVDNYYGAVRAKVILETLSKVLRALQTRLCPVLPWNACI